MIDSAVRECIFNDIGLYTMAVALNKILHTQA